MIESAEILHAENRLFRFKLACSWCLNLETLIKGLTS